MTIVFQDNPITNGGDHYEIAVDETKDYLDCRHILAFEAC